MHVFAVANLYINQKKVTDQLINFPLRLFIGNKQVKTTFCRYEVAIGESVRGTQILPYTLVPADQTRITLTDLDMTQSRKVFVTIRGYNGAGMYTQITSSGIYISRVSGGLEPLKKLVVNDGQTIGTDL